MCSAPIDYQSITYYSAPKSLVDNPHPKSVDEIDAELRHTYDRLGIPLKEQEALSGVAVDAGPRRMARLTVHWTGGKKRAVSD